MTKPSLAPDAPPPASSSRDRMLGAAKRLFASKGFEHASTSSIARLAGTSESQLIKHFGGKQGLLEAIFVAGWNEITGQARRDIADLRIPADKLRVLAQTVMRAIETDTDLQQLMLLEGRRMRKDMAGVTITEGFLGFVRLVDSVFYEMQVTGQLRPEIHPQAARSALMGMLEGLLRDRLLAQRAGFPAAYNPSEMNILFALVLSCFGPGPPASSNPRS